MVERSLQIYGWERGWATVAGDRRQSRHHHGPLLRGRRRVANGRFGVGLAIDFFTALSAEDGALSFTYPHESVFLPASVAVLARAREPDGRAASSLFCCRRQASALMMRPDIRRLPVLPELYAEAPAGTTNPFREDAGPPDAGRPPFDRKLSAIRYELVNLLFDEMITFRSNELDRLWTRLRDCERHLAGHPNAEAARFVAEARQTLVAVPVDEGRSRDPSFTAGLRRVHAA